MAFVDGENGENFMTEIFGFTQFSRSDTFKQVKDLNKFGMDYEKKYKEALGWMQGMYGGLHGKTKEEAEKYFPELKESEDERNIKDLIDELKCSLRAANCQNEACNGGHEKRIALLEWAITWLERQGKTLDPDKVIEWLKNEFDDSTYGKAMIERFKKDFGL